jgi:hypothetical protein
MSVNKLFVFDKMFNKITTLLLAFHPLYITTNAFINIHRNHHVFPSYATQILLAADKNYTRINVGTESSNSSTSNSTGFDDVSTETLHDLKQTKHSTYDSVPSSSASGITKKDTSEYKNNSTVSTSPQPIENVSTKVPSAEVSQPSPAAQNSSADAALTSSSSAVTVNPHLQLIENLTNKYKNKFICTSIPKFSFCEVYLCGTLHVAKTSSEMVADIIRTLKPHYVILEICESRADSLHELDPPNITLSDVIRECVHQRSVKVLGMGLLSWMQLKSAKILGKWWQN